MSVSATANIETRFAGAERWWNRRSRWLTLLVFAAVILAYLPVFRAGYIWDDAGHVTRPELRSLGGLMRIWFDVGATQQYYPVLHSAFWLESHVWGDAALGYHLVNVLLHATSACLLAAVLRRLAIPGAWIAALLFALHPVAVESVAWVSEQKNTLSTVLYLCAALVYLRYDDERRRGLYGWATLLFALALGSKTVAATLPAALLVVFWWKRGRLDWRRDVLPLLPWFALALVGAAMTSWVERTLIGASGAAFNLSLLERALLAGRVVCFYAAKLLWPANLMFVYPRWTVDATEAWQYLFPLVAVGALVACWAFKRRGTLAALLIFGGTLVPALGFVNVFPFVYSYVADHFQYLADVAAWSLVGAGAAALLARWSTRLGIAILCAVAATLGVLTWNQATIYRDEFSLYEATLVRNPAAWMAHTNLGIALARAGRGREALPHYEAALRLRPNYAEGENNLASALNAEGRSADALPHLERALQLQPNYPEAHNNLGIALLNLGRTPEGIAQLETALRLNPNFAEAHFNLGLALARSGRTAEAIAQFATAVRQRPDYAEAELNWAVGLTLSDRFADAEPHFKRALELNAESWLAHHLYGRALVRAGRDDDAVAQLSSAIELNPGSGDTHLNLGLALQRLGRREEAAREFQEAARLGATTP